MMPWSEIVKDAERKAAASLSIEETIIDELIADNTRLRSVLKEYADPRNWGISRDDLNHRVVSWIGPGADERPLPRPMKLAQDALDDRVSA